MSNNNGLERIQEQLDKFMKELDKQTGAAMERVTDAMERTGMAAAMLQEAELNTFVIQAFLQARERLVDSLEKAKSSPLLAAAIGQQVDNLEMQLVEEMTRAGVPKTAARKAIDAATNTVAGRIEQPRQPKGIAEGGQYAEIPPQSRISKNGSR